MNLVATDSGCHLYPVKCVRKEHYELLGAHSAVQSQDISHTDAVGLKFTVELAVSVVPKFAGSNPAEAVGFFRAKNSSARLPSEGK